MTFLTPVLTTSSRMPEYSRTSPSTRGRAAVHRHLHSIPRAWGSMCQAPSSSELRQPRPLEGTTPMRGRHLMTGVLLINSWIFQSGMQLLFWNKLSFLANGPSGASVTQNLSEFSPFTKETKSFAIKPTFPNRFHGLRTFGVFYNTSIC